MSSQYPLPPNAHSAAAVPLAYMPEYEVPPSGHDPEQLEQGHVPSKPLRTRKEAISQSSQKLKRSMSTNDASMPRRTEPNPPQSTLPGDKRKNKLGYHRTSVACGHCRRRKIRCIPEHSDTQGRCANCIRLRKECVFQSIDVQTAADSGSKTSSRASAGPKATSASSSPAPVPAMSSVPGQPNAQFQGLGMIPAHRVPHDGDLDSDTYVQNSKDLSGAESAARVFDFSNQPLVNWAAPDASPASTTKSLDLNMPWRTYSSHDSPIPPSFSPYTPNAPLPTASWSAPVAEVAQREDMAWAGYAPAHPRSIPYGADGRDSPHGSVLPQQVRHFERKPIDAPVEGYAPSTVPTMSGGVGMSMTTMGHSAPLVAPTVPSNDFGWHQQQQFQYARAQPGVAGWAYGAQPAHLGVQTPEHIPTTLAGQPPHQPGMYYAER